MMSESGLLRVWSGGEAYEPYVGRWSRVVAQEFLHWLDLPSALRWLDVGCGTGALSQAILTQANPQSVDGVDPSESLLSVAQRQVQDPLVTFQPGNAGQLPFASAHFDVVVCGLVLNFVPNLGVALEEMRRVARPKGVIAAYVWDYADKMELIRYFWDAAVALKPEDRYRDEAVRFPICNPGPLQSLFSKSGLSQVQVRAIDTPTHFQNFEEYWSPFLRGHFPAPDYAMALSEENRQMLREQIRNALPIETDGSIRLIARAWAVRGIV
jgi:SAM-dependent methyltransferase